MKKTKLRWTEGEKKTNLGKRIATTFVYWLDYFSRLLLFPRFSSRDLCQITSFDLSNVFTPSMSSTTYYFVPVIHQTSVSKKKATVLLCQYRQDNDAATWRICQFHPRPLSVPNTSLSTEDFEGVCGEKERWRGGGRDYSAKEWVHTHTPPPKATSPATIDFGIEPRVNPLVLQFLPNVEGQHGAGRERVRPLIQDPQMMRVRPPPWTPLQTTPLQNRLGSRRAFVISNADSQTTTRRGQGSL